MKNTLLKFAGLTFTLLLFCHGYAQKKTFIRDYIYQESENDSKNTARAAAVQQMQILLLQEIGQAIQSEQTLRKLSVAKGGKETFSEDFSQEVMAITAGFVEMKILHEAWNGKTYYIEAQMTVDPKEVSQRIAKVLDDKNTANPTQTPVQPKSAVEEKQAQRATLTTPANLLFFNGKEIYQDRRKLDDAELRKLKANKEVWQSYCRNVYQNGRLLEKSEIFDLMVNDKTLSLRDGKVYQNGKELAEYELQYLNLTTNNETLRLYNKGISKNKKGNACFIAYGVIIGAGAPIGGIAMAYNDPNNGAEAFLVGFGIGVSMGVIIGFPLLVTGITLKLNGMDNIQKSVDMYNNGGKTSNAVLKFGFTGNGVGLALNF